MNENNRLTRMVNRLAPLPSTLRHQILTRMIARVVKLVGTAKVDFLELAPTRVHVRLKNRSPVQNHIGSVHAAGIALLAETATGFVVGMSVPDQSVPVIKSMKIEYKKRAFGDMEAVANLNPDEIAQIRSQEKGELTVPVIVTDGEGKQPVLCEMVWAWVPKRR
jgi:acyl-coenzyme A thioesterase PaaI-like protein